MSKEGEFPTAGETQKNDDDSGQLAHSTGYYSTRYFCLALQDAPPRRNQPFVSSSWFVAHSQRCDFPAYLLRVNNAVTPLCLDTVCHLTRASLASFV